MQNSLQEFVDQKEFFLEEFMTLIGLDMTSGIVKRERKRLSEKLEAENKKMTELVTERGQLESSLQTIKRSASIESKMHSALEAFTSKLFSYDWCDNCYDEEAVRKYAVEMVTARNAELISPKPKQELKPQSSKDTFSPKENPNSQTPSPAETSDQLLAKQTHKPQNCQKDCLLRYHIFCDQLNQDLTEQVRKIRTTAKSN